MSLAPGSTFGRYQVLSTLGAGGMGEVFLAHDTRLNRRVALKLLRSDGSLDPNQLERFVQEARAASALAWAATVTRKEFLTMQGACWASRSSTRR
jgi:serine/threonine protein kinase